MAKQIITKKCCICKQIKSSSEFNKHSRRKDGLQTCCKICNKIYQKQYKQTEAGKISQRKYAENEAHKIANRLRASCYKKQYPERIKAKNAVQIAVKSGKIQHAFRFRCVCCYMPASEYHHHIDYAPKHRLDIVPICRSCHSTLHQKNEHTSKQVDCLRNSA